jgi:hypothetical protein
MALKLEPELVERLRARGGVWACYQNQALDSPDAGKLRFLKIGVAGKPIATPPLRHPNTPDFSGWHYGLVGIVNLEFGEVERVET